MERLDFNKGWLFGREAISLPHDAMVTAARSADAPSGGGCAYFEGGIYEYEKTFTVPKEWKDKEIILQFEGVYRNAEVSLNGTRAGGAAYGYIPFFVPLKNLRYGSENIVKVVADNSAQPNSRWYTGGGIYRPVWLWVCEKGGLVPEGIRITTLSYSPAKIRVESIEGAEVEICYPRTVCVSGNQSGAAVAGEDADIIASGKGAVVELEIPNAKLWSAETPDLYTCRVKAGEDVWEETFGIRMIEWSGRGLFINGKETLLRGGCIHHDNGILGAATYRESEWRRAGMLKEAGYNALRISHNPASAAMLEACDYYGLYVMDETWDMWYSRKNKADYGLQFMDNYQSDIRAMVTRDYNHPSVILYSIGNEVSEPASEKGVGLAREMIALCHELDGSRPVTAGMNLMILARSAKGKAVYDENGGGRDESNEKKMSGMNSMMFNMMTNMVGTGMNKGANSKKADAVTSPVLDALDIAGYNYASGRYPLEGKAHPDRVIFGSETFPQDIAKNWAMVKKYPYLVGDFMWTAWDYLGEAGGGTWAYTADGKGFQKPYPWLLADMGAIDILGNPCGELFWAQAVWGLLKEPKIAVRPVNHPGVTPAKSSWRGTDAIPSWGWRGCDGNKAVVEVYFDCDCVELKLNGRRIGKKKAKDCRTVFKTKYAPGTLEAVAYGADGRELSHSRLESARAADIWIAPETETAEEGAIVYVPVSVGDGRNVECNADSRLSVRVTGGELLAFGSANPRTEERFYEGEYTTYYGRALAVVRCGGQGKLEITVGNRDKKKTAQIVIR